MPLEKNICKYTHIHITNVLILVQCKFMPFIIYVACVKYILYNFRPLISNVDSWSRMWASPSSYEWFGSGFCSIAFEFFSFLLLRLLLFFFLFFLLFLLLLLVCWMSWWKEIVIFLHHRTRSIFKGEQQQQQQPWQKTGAKQKRKKAFSQVKILSFSKKENLENV